ncbi:hypothetical protein [Salinarchaeum laminariae]|uniref:hypothetical protein n=1 Tax=Salinarchaeum laminariae TaxID=869888 RepID=UPI0020BE0EC9|nr:hypothetical protein [Salinarchaeum laminariae]
MPVPVAPSPDRSLPVLFVAVALAVLATRIYVNGAALWPSLWMGIAAGAGATVVTWALDRRGE